MEVFSAECNFIKSPGQEESKSGGGGGGGGGGGIWDMDIKSNPILSWFDV